MLLRLIPLLVLANPLLAAAPHSGMVVHDGFEASDVALFGAAVLGVWLARRSMRARFRRKD